jgi:hypothetical protein
MTKESGFLLLAAVGLVPIALSYGVYPAGSMNFLFDIDASSINSSHIFRAIMGLYLAMIIFWIIGARHESLRLAALWSLTVFMLGLAAGRVMSLLIDGMPHWLLLVYLVLEVVSGAIGFVLARRYA